MSKATQKDELGKMELLDCLTHSISINRKTTDSEDRQAYAQLKAMVEQHFSNAHLIPMGNGASQCKYCGEIRDFHNSIIDLNDPKRKTNPLNLPKMTKVKLDKESKS